MYQGTRLVAGAALAFLYCEADPAEAREFYIGGPVVQHDMEIVANYLVGIDMAPMTPGMLMSSDPDVVHVEADVHATADSVYGFADGAWIPYLTIGYQLEKKGSAFRASGTLKPMTAQDGPHYAENVKMNGPGDYVLTYTFTPPEQNGFFHHTDAETGVPAWWAPFTQQFTFHYPQN